jgi:hypothetical protein
MNDFSVKFLDKSPNRGVYPIHPIRKASSFESLNRKCQVEKYGKEILDQCPGISDYKKYGWIMPAWDDIFIKATKNHTIAYIGSRPIDGAKSRATTGMTCPGRMDRNMIDGLVHTDISGYEPLHFGCPWGVETENVSLFLLPAYYHSRFLDDIIIYPGIVDYQKGFSTISFICSPKRECEIRINAGEPLLHIIPFTKNITFDGYCGKADSYFEDKSKGLWSSCKQFYRRYVMKKNNTTMKNID